MIPNSREPNRWAAHRSEHRGRALRQAIAVLSALLIALLSLVMIAGPAAAQDIDVVISELEDNGFYIEPGGDGTSSDFRALVNETDNADDEWYFVSMAGPVDADFADTLREQVRPTGNVIVLSLIHI